ncbi:HSP90 family protein [Streptoalloteichus hindustanus]|uniref:Molecular chaperone HtpG n=1 Tax=Streptoalloteichus hindustanus TaxID=2017 RepID=A0A1M5HJ91_STRHI|nr:HSP90 family protein [Streptoalloteichus hindustanus]SHG15882.1 molecular chaperone HtpG [Streptoalloteichus hindustanus]
MTHTFGVNLRGVIDLLSHHLYSSPRVYVRELLQNAVDAITARRAVEPDAPATVVIEPAETTGTGRLRVTDSGIGLTEDEVHALLSTLGSTSKRDELGFARQGFLGQFGVGMLSCFLVAERVELTTRSAKGGPAVRWVADASGSYSVEVDERFATEVGTTVELVPRPDAEHWLCRDVVAALAEEFGSLLPVSVDVRGPGGDQRVTLGELPWLRGADESPEEHEARLSDYCEAALGFRPFGVLPVSAPAAGLTGAIFVLPGGAHPGNRQAHRVYLKRMLVGTAVEGLLPDWAYFARCVVNTETLRPTASREALYEDETLLAVRDQLGASLRDWMVRLGASQPERAGALLATHHLGIKSVALVDDEMLRLAERWLPFETTEGVMPLRQFRRRYPTLLYTPDADEFRQLAPVAEAQGIGLVNAGYAYDTELVRRLGELEGASVARRVEPTELLAALDSPAPEVAAGFAPVLSVAERVLARHDCAPVLREFDPVSLPALLISDPAGQRRQDAEQARQDSDPLWADLLERLVDEEPTASQRLVLNARNPLAQRLPALGGDAVAELVVESLYVHAVLQSRRPLRPRETAALNHSFLALLDRAVQP